jgi:acetyl-CoA synthetase (ADP-forming)/acetyltransferase
MTDICARAGLEIPILSDAIQRGIARLVPEANTSCKNPVDLGFVGFSPKVYSQAIRETARETGLDALMLYQATEYYSRFSTGFDWVQVVSSELGRIRQEVSTPFVAVVPPLEQDNLDMIAKRQSFIQKLRHSQIPVFPTVERAAKVLFRLQQYHRFLNQE